MPGLARDLDRAPQQFGPLPDADETKAPPGAIWLRPIDDAHPVVLHRETNDPTVERQLDVDVAGLGVLAGIGDGFLTNGRAKTTTDDDDIMSFDQNLNVFVRLQVVSAGIRTWATVPSGLDWMGIRSSLANRSRTLSWISQVMRSLSLRR